MSLIKRNSFSSRSTNIHLVGISGSLQKASINTALLKAAQELLLEKMTMEFAEIGDLPLYNSDIDGELQPQSVKEFRNILVKANAFLFVSTDFNFPVQRLAE